MDRDVFVNPAGAWWLVEPDPGYQIVEARRAVGVAYGWPNEDWYTDQAKLTELHGHLESGHHQLLLDIDAALYEEQRVGWLHLVAGATPMAGGAVAFSPTQAKPIDLTLHQEDLQKILKESDDKKQKDVEAAIPKVKAWLEPQRSEIEGRANSTRVGLIEDPEAMVTLPKLVDRVLAHVPEAAALDTPKLKEVITSWAGFDIPEVALVKGQVPVDQIAAQLEDALRVPGKIKVQRRGDDFIEVNLESVLITEGPVQAGAFWNGGVGLQVQPREWVAGSFQLNPDGTWKGQLIFGKNATPPVVNQMYNVWNAAHGAMKSIAQTQDQSLVDTLSGPVKDAVDSLNSISSKEEPKVGVSVTASGGGPTGGWAVEATVTVRF